MILTLEEVLETLERSCNESNKLFCSVPEGAYEKTKIVEALIPFIPITADNTTMKPTKKFFQRRQTTKK